MSLWHKDDFHAGKGSIIGAGVSNIIIPPVIDSFSACPAITVSSCDSLSSTVLYSVIREVRERPASLSSKQRELRQKIFSLNNKQLELEEIENCFELRSEEEPETSLTPHFNCGWDLISLD